MLSGWIKNVTWHALHSVRTPRPLDMLERYSTWTNEDGFPKITSGVASLNHLMGKNEFRPRPREWSAYELLSKLNTLQFWEGPRLAE